ncbi:MAG: hypothetical protein KF855_17015 [Acidobacteria bacterium]|nr:hypothetical protein [Acidobacteriota bacterium]
MAAVLVQELLEKVNALSETDRAEFLRRLNEPVRKEAKPNGSKSNGQKQEKKKDFVLHPNTVWVKENSHLYPGQYVVLKDGKLIATGRTIRDAHFAAKAKGVKDTKGYLFHYILAEGEEAYCGGWL